MRSASQLWPTFLAYSVSLWISDVYASRLTSRSFAFITPHAEYSSSVGVLGCKVDMNRIAYWPLDVRCDGICVKVSNEGRSLHLLRIDKSGGFGASAIDDPLVGGGIQMSYEIVDTSECRHLLHEGKLPLSAANSMNYVSSCISQPTSWVAQNYQLYNINDPVCKYGVDEKSNLDLTTSNPLQIESRVKNVAYGTGEIVPV
ncbi:uncharacterized protein BKA55DRAFT_598524 [Fusarium redolens]|uniref:Cerato-platanin n=1 Tax=Fusarium redolens TaxID=48865 RepID=A0A9P9G3J5_FUSRE|nr:uncharacterized protein BKA55DRAFT_598524 [Fusarium redolens]KAH7231858.1 hypothetical protein BKA55DRAFT_598524 [Fusarium redolens]